MSISGIGASSYQVGYAARQTGQNNVSKGYANQIGNTAATQSMGTRIALHISNDKDGESIGSYGLADGTSATVYKTKDFDANNPTYKVKMWDKTGNVIEERMVDISKVNPQNSDSIDMFAYTSHLSKTGECPNAQSAFIRASSNPHGLGNIYESPLDKENWVQIVKNAMKTQYDLGNLQGYMDYKKFWDFLEQ